MNLWSSITIDLYSRSCRCSCDHVKPLLSLFHSYCCLYLLHWLPTSHTVWGSLAGVVFLAPFKLIQCWSKYVCIHIYKSVHYGSFLVTQCCLMNSWWGSHLAGGGPPLAPSLRSLCTIATGALRTGARRWGRVWGSERNTVTWELYRTCMEFYGNVGVKEETWMLSWFSSVVQWGS